MGVTKTRNFSGGRLVQSGTFYEGGKMEPRTNSLGEGRHTPTAILARCAGERMDPVRKARATHRKEEDLRKKRRG